MATNELALIPAAAHVALASTRGSMRAEDLMPVLDIALARKRRDFMLAVTKDLMVEGTDYGVIPGTPKPTLLKPGAERLNSLFGFEPEFTIEREIEDWTGGEHAGEPLFYYRIKCRLMKNGYCLGEGIGSASTWESKYRYRWMDETQVPAGMDKATLTKRGGMTRKFEPKFAIDKAETGGKYGKPAEYWAMFADGIAAGTAERGKKTMGGKEYDGFFVTLNELQFRIPNPDVHDQANTALKMAQKRSLIAATLLATNASEFYSQDLEDLAPIDIQPYSAATVQAETPAEVAARRIAEEQTKARNTPPSQSAQAQPAGPADPDVLRDLLAGCTKAQGIKDAMANMGDRASGMLGEEAASKVYAAVGAELKITSFSELMASANKAKAFLRAWYNATEAAVEAMKPAVVATAAPAAAVTDTDLPGELFPASKDSTYSE